MTTTESSKKKWLVGTAVLMLLVVAVFGFWVWLGLGYITTDDARIKADIITISTEVPGRISALLKDEGDQVEPGAIMVELDKQEILIRIEQHKAAVDHARSQLLQVERELGHASEGGQREIKEADLLAKKARVREAEAELRELEVPAGADDAAQSGEGRSGEEDLPPGRVREGRPARVHGGGLQPLLGGSQCR